MSSPASQFARVESFGLVASGNKPRGKKYAEKIKSTVSGVCGEMARKPGFCSHVEETKPPVILFGKDPLLVQSSIEQAWASQQNALRGSGQKVRKKDALVMVAGVLSYPNKEKTADTFKWAKASIAWLQEEYGDRLQSVVAHNDEGNYHLHFIVVDFKTLRVDQGLDPAKTAQKVDRKNQSAQRQALQDWQDRYHSKVSSKFGHVRKIGARDRIHGSPKMVREMLALLAQVAAENEKLTQQKQELAARESELLAREAKVQEGVLANEQARSRLKETRDELKERAKGSLEFELALKERAKALEDAFLLLEKQKTEAVKQGNFKEAEKAHKAMEAMRIKVQDTPALSQMFQNRPKSPLRPGI